MSKSFNLYIGQAGHLLVMSELLYRGWNVATPQVDRGDDVFVVKDENGDLKRVQVKTANGKALSRGGIKAQFSLRLDQLETPRVPDIHYIFVIRDGDKWLDFVVIMRRELSDIEVVHKIGSRTKNKLILSMTITSQEIKCSGYSLKSYRNNWKEFPIINH